MTSLSAIFVMFVAFSNESEVNKGAIIKEMTERLLDGQVAPANIESRLMQLDLADRIEVVIFLRRAGLLSGRSLSVDRLLYEETEMEAPH